MCRLRLDLLILLSLTSLTLLAADFSSPQPAGIDAPSTFAGGVPAEGLDAEEEPHYPDLPVLFIMDWTYPGASAELRRMEAVGGVFEQLREDGWTVGVGPGDQLRIVSVDEVRPLVQRLNLTVFPAVVAYHGNDVIRSFRAGCATPLDEHTFCWMRTGVNSRPADAPREPVTVEWSGSYPLRGAHWSVEGSYAPTLEQVLRHLRGGNHRHLIPADWAIESWSYEELRSLHDDLHEQNRPRELMSMVFQEPSETRPDSASTHSTGPVRTFSSR